ncbi:MAG: hypothetical protein ACXVZQ_08840, partial [Terriglobales bacterium]
GEGAQRLLRAHPLKGQQFPFLGSATVSFGRAFLGMPQRCHSGFSSIPAATKVWHSDTHLWPIKKKCRRPLFSIGLARKETSAGTS